MLPAAHDRLALLIGCQIEEFEQVWPAIADKFTIQDGIMWNDRLEEHRLKAEKKKKRHAEGAALTNAKLAAERDAKRTLSDTDSDSPSETLSGTPPSPSPSLRSSPILISQEYLALSPTTEVGRSRIDEVFDHWKQTWDHPKAMLDVKRRRLIELRLKSYSVRDLCDAISGYRNSPHHCGTNDRHTVYDSIELLLRDNGHVDAGLAFTRGPVAEQVKTLTTADLLARGHEDDFN